jgi:hypothetical protein
MSDLTLEVILAKAAEAGAQAAAGIDSILSLGFVVWAGTRAKAVTAEQVRDVYVAYATAANGSKFGSKIDLAKKDAVDVAVSKLGVFNRLAAIPGNSFDVAALRTAKVCDGKDDGAKLGGSRYEAVLKVARAVISAESTNGFTEKKIREILTPKVKAATVVRELEKLIKAATDAATAFPLSSLHFSRVAETAKAELESYKGTVIDAAKEDEAEITSDDLDSMANALNTPQEAELQAA